MVPIIGGSAIELLSQVIAPPLERRRDEWARSIAAGLEAVEVRVDELGTRAELLDVFLLASASAMRTSSQEKLEALRNAVVNAAIRAEPDQDERTMFVQMVDRFTPTHLLLLKAFDDPAQWAREHKVNYQPSMFSGLDKFLEAAFPELRERQEFYDSVWSELWTARVVTTDQLHANMSAQGWEASRASGLGKRFLRFIATPERP